MKEIIILDKLNTSKEWADFSNTHFLGSHYVASNGFRVSFSGPDKNGLVIGDVRDAFKRGKVCSTYSIALIDRKYGTDEPTILNLMASYDYDINKLFLECEALDFRGHEYDGAVLSDDFKVYLRECPGVKTFSPFSLDRLNPLKEIPSKWRIAHVVRMLANDQFKDLTMRSRYTDDYAYDAAVNFGNGTQLDRNGMLRTLVERSGGGWVSGGTEDGGKLGINCHSFEYNECTIKLGDTSKRKKRQVKSKKAIAVSVSDVEVKETKINGSKITPPNGSKVAPLFRRPAGILMKKK